MYPTTSVTCCNLLSFHCFWYRPTLELFATCPLHSLMLGIGPRVYEICQWFSLANLNMGVFFCMQHVGLNFHVAYDGALQFLRCLRSHGLCKIKLSYFWSFRNPLGVTPVNIYTYFECSHYCSQMSGTCSSRVQKMLVDFYSQNGCIVYIGPSN